jgi:PAS domain S-box-containing protein
VAQPNPPNRDPEKREERPERPSLTEVLLRSLASAVVAVDSKHTVTAFNATAERITGLDAGRVLHQSIETLPAPLRALLHETFASGASLTDRQIVITSLDGAEVIVRANTFAYSKEGGRIDAVLLLCHDVSSARKLEANVRRLDRLANIGNLSASAAHEIKNALVAIKTFVDRLLETQHEKELAGLVSQEVDRIDSIASQLLKLSGPARPALAAVNLHRVLDNTLRLTVHQLDSHQIKLERSFAATNDVINADEKQLGQAFVNLLLNAIEAMDGPGTLRVATDPVSPGESVLLGGAISIRWIRLIIADSGPGIAAAHLPYVFDRFFTTKADGTGLGLPITRSIVEEHGGMIFVESEPGKGTAFRIVLPLVGG